MYIVVATNIYGIDEAPAICEKEEQLTTAMRYFMVYGIANQKPEIIEDFCSENDIVKFYCLDELEEIGYTDKFFEYIASKYDAEIGYSTMKIRFSSYEGDVYEVNCWDEESIFHF